MAGLRMYKGIARWLTGALVVYSDGSREVVQYGLRTGECVASMIDKLTCPGTCMIAVAGDSSRCMNCGHRFDTNTEDGNVPPDCRRELDPIRGGLLT